MNLESCIERYYVMSMYDATRHARVLSECPHFSLMKMELGNTFESWTQIGIIYIYIHSGECMQSNVRASRWRHECLALTRQEIHILQD